MNIIQSIFLGIVQGITEFLPVSSSGHLAIIQNLLGINTDGGLLFDILLHLGTLVAVCLVFHKDLARMLVETIAMIGDLIGNLQVRIHNHKEQDARRYKKIIHNNYRKFVLMVLISTIPTGIIGVAASELVELANTTLITPGICLILTAMLLLIADVVENGRKVPKDISYSNAFFIGIAQGLSILPGLSRSGTTIAACLISGFDRRFAVRYSFIMSIPAVLGAVILEIHKAAGANLALGQIGIYLVGAVFAGLTGYFCIRKMLVIVRKKKFKGFAVYCLIAGIVAITGYFVLR
ncbi:MAG: undecaprenyl-diphosphate phosphatase [Eubacteriales bacterium]|nr:undecaprenyl-diphosphate phosphatase [Eubacteriales bacterium]